MSGPAVTCTLVKIETFPLTIHLAIPPQAPQIKGYITVDCAPRNREQNRELLDQNLSDAEFLKQIAVNIRGLGNKAGPIEGDAAFEECINGEWSAWLLPAIVSAYYEQFGEGRRKNSGPSRGR